MNTKANATKTPNDVKLLPVNTGKENGQPNRTQAENEIKAILSPTAEQRLKNLKNFQLLGQRYENLLQKQDELNTFNVSNDATQDKLKLTNSSGFSFTLGNTLIIDEVINLLGNHLEKKIAITQKEILEFSI
jgi:hypothetical protein